MKICTKCHVLKPLSEFHKHRITADGVRSQCKECTLAANNARWAKYLQDPDWVMKERERCRIKAKNHGKNWKKPNPVHNRNWVAKNKLKRWAHSSAGSAQRIGKLVKPDACQVCGLKTTELDKHHEDHTKSLEVIWLCKPCHGLTRRKPRPDAPNHVPDPQNASNGLPGAPTAVLPKSYEALNPPKSTL